MVKQKSRMRSVDTDAPDPEVILVLLRAIPTPVFVQMVSKAGLPTAQARELCDAFRRLKE